MKLSTTTTNQDDQDFKLCIGLEPPPSRDPDNHARPISFECRRTPGDEKSPAYTLKVYPYEDGDSPEIFVMTRQVQAQIERGQKIETNAEKVVLIRQLFQGAALTAFETEMPAPTANITDAQLKKGIAAMTKVAFPEKAGRNQKKAMLKLKKPLKMSFRTFANRMKKINDMLSYFPPTIYRQNQAIAMTPLTVRVGVGVPTSKTRLPG